MLLCLDGRATGVDHSCVTDPDPDFDALYQAATHKPDRTEEIRRAREDDAREQAVVDEIEAAVIATIERVVQAAMAQGIAPTIPAVPPRRARTRWMEMRRTPASPGQKAQFRIPLVGCRDNAEAVVTDGKFDFWAQSRKEGFDFNERTAIRTPDFLQLVAASHTFDAGEYAKDQYGRVFQPVSDRQTVTYAKAQRGQMVADQVYADLVRWAELHKLSL